jgi:hypothetical protein
MGGEETCRAVAANPEIHVDAAASVGVSTWKVSQLGAWEHD